MDESIFTPLDNAGDCGVEIDAESEKHVSALEEIDLQSVKNDSSQTVHSSNSRKGKTIPGLAREVIVKVAEVCEQEANKNIPLFSLNAPTRRAAMYTGVSERTIQRIRAEDRKRKLQGDKEGANCKTHKTVSYLDKEINYSLKRQSRKGQVIPSSARDIISRVIISCYKEFEDGEYLAPLICRTRRAALYTGVSVRTIQRIKQEDEVRNKVDEERSLATPGKKRKRTTFRDKIDEFDFHCIRMLIDDIILNKRVYPTCSYLLKAIKESKIGFPYAEDTLFRLLHGKGFNWRPGLKGKKMLLEKETIFLGRISCIRSIKKHEGDGKCIVYLDDKFIGQDTDNTYCDKNGIFDAEGGICCSGRLIAFTEFSVMGIARRIFRMFRPNGEYFTPKLIVSTVEKWLKENLFPNIPERCLIIMSTNAYDQNGFNIPNEYSTKSTLIEFLKYKKLKYDKTQTWVDLYDIIKKYLETQPQDQWSEIDKIIEQHGHIALRLPIYMSEFSPIELAYADIKRCLRSKITPAKVSLNVVKETTWQALENFQVDTFQGYLNHVINMENYFLQIEKRMQKYYDDVAKKDVHEYCPLEDNVTLQNSALVGSPKENNTVVFHGISNHNIYTSISNVSGVKVNNNTCYSGLDRTNMFEAISPYSQIIYGKTIVTPVVDKSVLCENQVLETDAVQAGPSYLNL